MHSESYTHDDWVYRDVCVGFSRLYYVIGGEAYYEEEGKVVRLRKNHLYLTPVRRNFTLYENAEDKLLHTYAHITTVPAIDLPGLRWSREHPWPMRFPCGANIFISAYHITPKNYFNCRRMDAALEKLRGGMLVKTVADDLGYASAYSFSKAFKKHFGQSPEQYMLKARETVSRTS